MSFISQRLDFFDSSDFQRAIELQSKLTDPVDLSIGVPEEPTNTHIKQAGIDAINNNKTIYTPANGISELRDEIAKKLQTKNQIPCTHSSVTIVPGLTTGQLIIYMAILDPGDEVIVFDPYYPPYLHLAKAIGANVRLVRTLPDFQPDIEALEANINNKTKMIIINSPNNPTGAVYPKETLATIAKIAEHHNILLLSDEIYEHFVYDKPHFSVGSIYPNTLTLGGFSKEYAMTGWRIGYITGPQHIIDAINEVQQYTVMSSSSISQHAALSALSKESNISHKYKIKRDLVRESLREMNYEVQGADGAYYIFVRTPAGLSDLEFTKLCADHNLIIVPGRAFSALHDYFRISYGTDIETIKKGMDILKNIQSELR